MDSHPRRRWSPWGTPAGVEVPPLRLFHPFGCSTPSGVPQRLAAARSGSGGGFTAVSLVATVAGHSRSRLRRWMTRFFYVSVMLGVAMMSASVIARIFLTENPLGGADGLFALYGETAGIALGLVVLRVLGETGMNDA